MIEKKTWLCTAPGRLFIGLHFAQVLQFLFVYRLIERMRCRWWRTLHTHIVTRWWVDLAMRGIGYTESSHQIHFRTGTGIIETEWTVDMWKCHVRNDISLTCLISICVADWYELGRCARSIDLQLVCRRSIAHSIVQAKPSISVKKTKRNEKWVLSQNFIISAGNGRI